jgi:hypothetical protein
VELVLLLLLLIGLALDVVVIRVCYWVSELTSYSRYNERLLSEDRLWRHELLLLLLLQVELLKILL